MTNDLSTLESSAMAPMGIALHVTDIEAARRFYMSLGFEQTAAFPRSDGQLSLAILVYGSCSLLVGRRDELHYENAVRARKIRRGPLGLGVAILLTVPDLAKIYNTVLAVGVEILLEPVNEFYGDRVFMFLDPDGYEWKISQTIAEVRQEEVAAIIGAT